MNNHPEIPVGYYCYRTVGLDAQTGRLKIEVCPHWSCRHDKLDQENGYCCLLGRGDWEVRGISLLWDQVKECGINIKDEDVDM